MTVELRRVFNHTRRSICLQAPRAVVGGMSGKDNRYARQHAASSTWLPVDSDNNDELKRKAVETRWVPRQVQDGGEISILFDAALEFGEWCAGSRRVWCASAPRRACLDTRGST